MRSDTFRTAADALDVDATTATFSSSVVLHSPVTDEPLVGKEAVSTLFAIPLRTFEDLRFVGFYTSTDGSELLHFRWRLGERDGEGVDMLRFDDHGLIEHYTVMARPLSAVVALRDSVFSQLPDPG